MKNNSEEVFQIERIKTIQLFVRFIEKILKKNKSREKTVKIFFSLVFQKCLKKLDLVPFSPRHGLEHTTARNTHCNISMPQTTSPSGLPCWKRANSLVINLRGQTGVPKVNLNFPALSNLLSYLVMSLQMAIYPSK